MSPRLRLALVLLGMAALASLLSQQPWTGLQKRPRPTPADFEWGNVQLLLPRGSHVASVEWEPDGQSLLTGARLPIRLARWDMQTGRARTLVDQAMNPRSNDVCVRYLGTDRVLGLFRRQEPVSGIRLVSLAEPGPYWLWGRTRADLSPDGRLVIAGDGTRQSGLLVWDAQTGAQVRKLDPRTWFPDSVSFSPDGTRLAVSGSASTGEPPEDWGRQGLFLFDLPSGRQTAYVPDSFCDPVRFAPDGSSVLVGGRRLTRRSLPKLRPVWTLPLPDQTTQIAVSSRGTVACGLSGGLIALTELEGGPLRLLKGHWLEVSALAFSPDGSLLASGSADGSSRIWSVGSGRERARLMVLEEGDWVAASPGGDLVGTPRALEQSSLKIGGEWVPADSVDGLIQERLPLRTGPEPRG